MTRFDPAWLDSMYNNRLLVPDFPVHFANWVRLSAQARASQHCALDLAYGPGAGEKLDVFQAPKTNTTTKAGAPVVVFIHGGYWRALDKADHSFVAPALNAAGATVVVPNYDLCPAVSIPDITLQMVRALAWTWHHIARYGGDPGRITVIGHSAGGHLAAMMLACQWSVFEPDLPADLVKNALSISGLFELESIMHTPFLQGDLRLTDEQVLKASPAWLPAPRHGQLYSVAGGDESAEFKRQNALIQAAWGRPCVPIAENLPGLNHFSMVEALGQFALGQTGHRLHSLALQLLAKTA
jgi:arylformamidase